MTGQQLPHEQKGARPAPAYVGGKEMGELLQGKIAPPHVRICEQGRDHPLATRGKQIAALDSPNPKLRRFALEALALSEIWPRVAEKIALAPASLGIAFRVGKKVVLEDAEKAVSLLKSLKSSDAVFCEITEAGKFLFNQEISDFFDGAPKEGATAAWLKALEQEKGAALCVDVIDELPRICSGIHAGVGTANGFIWRFFATTAAVLGACDELSIEKASSAAKSALPLLVQFASLVDVNNIESFGRGLEYSPEESSITLGRCPLDGLTMPGVFTAFHPDHFTIEGDQLRLSEQSIRSVGRRLDFSSSNIEILGCPALHASCQGHEGRRSNVFVEHFNMLHRMYEQVVIPALLSQRNNSR
jgi:hypothetical protein